MSVEFGESIRITSRSFFGPGPKNDLAIFGPGQKNDPKGVFFRRQKNDRELNVKKRTLGVFFWRSGVLFWTPLQLVEV